MASRGDGPFLQRLALQIARLAVKRARSIVKSRAIKREMVPQPRVSSKKIGRASAHVPFYWARYYHDGRGPIRARRGRKLVFYKNVDDDPRNQGALRDYPRTRRQRRRLSKSQFARDLRAGKIVAVSSVGATTGTFFFTKGMRQFPSEIGRVTQAAFSQHILACLRKDGLLRPKSNRKVTLVI